MVIPITLITAVIRVSQGTIYSPSLAFESLLTFHSTACGTLENAFEFDSLSPNATAYGYCALMHSEIIPKCTACIAQSDEFFVTNCKFSNPISPIFHCSTIMNTNTIFNSRYCPYCSLPTTTHPRCHHISRRQPLLQDPCKHNRPQSSR